MFDPNTLNHPAISSYHPSPDALPSMSSMVVPGSTPWSWTSEEANQYLFQQIENDFSFGEGWKLDWGTGQDGLLQDPTLFQPEVGENGITM